MTVKSVSPMCFTFTYTVSQKSKSLDVFHKDVDIEAVTCIHNLQYRFSIGRPMFVNIFGKRGPIFKILLPINSLKKILCVQTTNISPHLRHNVLAMSGSGFLFSVRYDGIESKLISTGLLGFYRASAY